MVQIKQSNFKCQDTPNDRTEKKKKTRGGHLVLDKQQKSHRSTMESGSPGSANKTVIHLIQYKILLT